MDTLLTQIWEEIYQWLNLGYILLLILMANVFINKAKFHLVISPWFGKENHTVYAVLLLAILISLFWIVKYIITKQPGESYMRLAISYCVATSIYEVFIKKFLSDDKKTP